MRWLELSEIALCSYVLAFVHFVFQKVRKEHNDNEEPLSTLRTILLSIRLIVNSIISG